MRTHWACGLGALLLALGNFGCYYDQWQQAERDNRVLREDLARTKQDLMDAEMLVRQKDTEIDALNKELAAKNETINSYMQQVAQLKEQLASAQALLQKYLDKPIGDVHIIKQALPQPLHEALEALAKQYPDVFEYLADKGAVRFKADLLFPLGSDELTAGTEASEALAKFAEIVQGGAAADFDVIVVGHTCTTPIRKADTLARHPTNWHLSAHRAISVMSLLAGQGVPMDRMGVMGYGEHRPIADNSTAEGKAANRRVEIFLVSKSSVNTVSLDIRAVPGHKLVFVPAVKDEQPGT